MFGYSSRELGWLAVAAGSAAVAGSLVNKAMERGWRASTDREPPRGTRVASESWRKALAWAIVTAATAAAAEVVAQKGAAAGWRKATGRKPPAV
jgi:hypothetical protein